MKLYWNDHLFIYSNNKLKYLYQLLTVIESKTAFRNKFINSIITIRKWVQKQQKLRGKAFLRSVLQFPLLRPTFEVVEQKQKHKIILNSIKGNFWSYKKKRKTRKLLPIAFNVLGPVVRTPVSANPGLNFNPGFFIFLSKALSLIIFSFLFRVSNYQIVGKEN